MAEQATDTDFGFEYGPAKVTRISSRDGHVWIEVSGAKGSVIVRVTPSGLVRIEK